MDSTFCDKVVAKQAVESCTGKRNLKISLAIIQEKCTGRFYNCKLWWISINALTHVKIDLDIGKRVKYWNIWTMPRGDTKRIIRTLGILRILRKIKILGPLRILQTPKRP